MHRLPGAVKEKNIVLKRGILLASSPLFNWVKETLEDGLAQNITPKEMSVTLKDPTSTSLITWDLTRAWPVKLEIATFESTMNEITVETL